MALPYMTLRNSLVGAAALVCVALLGSRFAGASAETIGETLIEIEQPRVAVEQMRTLPDAVAAASAATTGAYPDQVVVAVKAAVESSYDPASVDQAIREALGKSPATADAARLETASKHLAATAAELQDLSAKDPQAAEIELQAKLDARPDKARIEELVTLMLSPQLQGEISLTALRIQRALALSGQELPPASDQAAISSEIDKFITSSRNEPGETTGPFSQNVGIAEGTARLRARLTLVPQEDIAALHAFYVSDEGRAAREALAKTFAARNDENGKAMLTSVLQKLKPAQ